MGFDIKRFRESDIKEEFICPICCDILEDPVLFEECEHVFCRQCIEEWLQSCQPKHCPIDRQEISEKSLRPPQRSFRNLITNLLISCDFSANGCQEYIKIDGLSVHSSNCAFNPVIMNQDIECPSSCGAIVKRSGSIDEHNCVSHLKTIIANNNNMIEILMSQNEELLEQNLLMKNERQEVLTKYNEAIKQLEALSAENREISIEMSNTKQKLSEMSHKSDQINATKDKTIDDMKTQIRELKKENQRLRELSDFSQNEVQLERLVSETPIETSELISFESFNNEMLLNDSNTETIDSDVLSIETSLENRKLVETLRMRGHLKNIRVIRSMLSIDRGLFAPSAASYALNHIRSIGYGAHTGPAAYEATVLQFLESHLTPNCKVLDIGSGTGYLTACIAKMIGPNGRVIGIEHIPQLVQQSIETLDKFYPHLKESGVLKVYLGDGRFGYSTEAPYDLIFIEPLTRRVPQKLIDQLRPNGCIVVPIGARDKDINLELFTKQTSGEVIRQTLCDDWKIMQENTPDLLEDKKLQLRTGWRVKLGF